MMTNLAQLKDRNYVANTCHRLITVVNIRNVARLIEPAKGKSSIEIGSTDELLTISVFIKKPVKAGELDTKIDNAANKLRNGFGK